MKPPIPLWLLAVLFPVLPVALLILFGELRGYEPPLWGIGVVWAMAQVGAVFIIWRER